MVNGGMPCGDVIDTISHEFGHAATPGAKHGYGWKDFMNRIGCDAKRCCSKKTSAVKSAIVKGKYRMYCPNGGITGRYGHYASWRHKYTARMQRGLICRKCKSALKIVSCRKAEEMGA